MEKPTQKCLDWGGFNMLMNVSISTLRKNMTVFHHLWPDTQNLVIVLLAVYCRLLAI